MPTAQHASVPVNAASNVAARVQPLSLHPQLQIFSTTLLNSSSSPTHTEYRVYNYRYLPSGRLVRGDGWGWIWIGFLAIAFWAYHKEESFSVTPREEHYTLSRSGFTIGLVTLGLLLTKSRTVLYQSIIPLPKLGLQLSTTRGISLPLPAHPFSGRSSKTRKPPPRILLPLFKSSTFIPLSQISTVVINEGIQRWSIVYYLAIVKRRGQGVVVALDEIKAPHAVLREVYHGIRETLFNEYDDCVPDNALHID